MTLRLVQFASPRKADNEDLHILQVAALLAFRPKKAQTRRCD